MPLQSTWLGRAVALWVGILAAWGAVQIIVLIYFSAILVPALLTTAALALLAGGVRTYRIRAEHVRDEPLITVDDLRKGR